MLISVHLLAGGFIGREVGYPPLAFILGVISHLLLDCIPHNDGPDDVLNKSENNSTSVGQYITIAIDVVLVFLALVYISDKSQISSGFFWGAIGGIFPDIVDNFPLWKRQIRKLPVFKQFHSFHYTIQKIKTPMWIGLFTQYLIGAIFLYLIIAIK